MEIALAAGDGALARATLEEMETITAQPSPRTCGGSGRTWCGIDVTPDDALHVSAFLDGVRIIAEDIGKLPFIVYRRRGEFREHHRHARVLTAHALMRGKGYALKNPGCGRGSCSCPTRARCHNQSRLTLRRA